MANSNQRHVVQHPKVGQGLRRAMVPMMVPGSRLAARR
jgi:hypothetical protein